METSYRNSRGTPEAVVFDMDGVIFDSERLVIVCWKEIAEKYQIPDIEEACIRCLGVNRKAGEEIFLEKYGNSFPYERYKAEMSRLFHSRYDHGNLPLKPGVVEILTALREQEIPIAIASSTRRQVVTEEIRDAGILPFFDSLVCGDMVAHSKPHPEIFLKACQVLGTDPARTAAIEDSFNGIRAAAAAGMRAIMVPDLKQPDQEIRSLAEAVLPDLNIAKKYLLNQG